MSSFRVLQYQKELRLEPRKWGKTETQDLVMAHSVIVQNLVLAGLFNGSRDFVGHLKVGIQPN